MEIFTASQGIMNTAIKLLPLFAAAIILPSVAAIEVHAQQPVRPEHQGKQHRGKHFKKLNLTSEQQAKMKQMRAETRTEMEKILTAEQKGKLRAMKDNKGGMRQGWKELNLTPEQKTKIKALHESQQAKLKAMLTPEQQAQMDKMKQERGARLGKDRNFPLDK
jgi:periplasmic protein CpxP/Spy